MKKVPQMGNMRGVQQVRHRLLPPGDEEATTLRSLTSLRWHYPDQVVRVFLSLHKEGHPESLRDKNVLSGQVTVSRRTTQAGPARQDLFQHAWGRTTPARAGNSLNVSYCFISTLFARNNILTFLQQINFLKRHNPLILKGTKTISLPLSHFTTSRRESNARYRFTSRSELSNSAKHSSISGGRGCGPRISATVRVSAGC